jgi:SAM-dependent methyltransferase
VGIELETAVGIYEGCRARGLRGNAVTLGKQDIDFGFDQLLIALADRGHLPRSGTTITISGEQMAVVEAFKADGRMLSTRPRAVAHQWLSDEFFFRFIGFEATRSVDYSQFEGADIAHDLNELGLASKTGACDFVYNGGTMEHVFHVPNVLRNIFDVLTIGGCVLHHSPSNNMLDHGFYQFSPTLLWDYHHANGYADIKVILAINVRGMAFRRDYAPGFLNAVSDGGLDDSKYMTVCWARKIATTTGDRIPQQGTYLPQWNESAAPQS